jgi:hypothetical protein
VRLSLEKNRQIKAEWVPANEVNNLTSVHKNYTSKIPAFRYQGLTIGVTSLLFCKWQMAKLKNQEETPYSELGRAIYEKRSRRKTPLARADEILTLQYSRLIAIGMVEKRFNFEFFMNRAYAFNRDKGKCKICSSDLNLQNLETHHINPNLPLSKLNKVNNLASLCIACHNNIHSEKNQEHLGSKVWKKILSYREKLND